MWSNKLYEFNFFYMGFIVTKLSMYLLICILFLYNILMLFSVTYFDPTYSLEVAVFCCFFYLTFSHQVL